MPWCARQLCRNPRCPHLAVDTRGYCPTHDPGPWSGTTAMPPGWHTTQPAVLDRDHHTCQTCGATATTVDHITPRSAGGTDDPSNLRALCTACHLTRSGQQGGHASGATRTTGGPT
jgi:5-methylcytosine-specific restriction enzyme A